MFDKLKYCIFFLENNPLRKLDHDYYKGLTDKQPHGIDNKYWKQAFNMVALFQ